jgi:hypothetical protein
LTIGSEKNCRLISLEKNKMQRKQAQNLDGDNIWKYIQERKYLNIDIFVLLLPFN